MNETTTAVMPERVIGPEQLKKAQDTLSKYQSAKSAFDDRIIANEDWYRVRHWERMKTGVTEKPASAWLLNSLLNKHADIMDNRPAPSVLPREVTDRAEARMLSAILPVILDQNEFEQTYNDLAYDKVKSGTGIYGVFWNPSKLNGLGDIEITRIDPLAICWEPGIRDIQRSRNVFYTCLVDNDVLESMYPQLVGKLGSSAINIKKHRTDDNLDVSDKSAVVDWYYKKSVTVVNAVGVEVQKTILHYVKFVGDEVLYSSEDDPALRERGFYDHGMYPFEFDVLYPCEGTPTGFGFIDIGKPVQEWIDRANQAIIRNMLANAKPRVYATEGSGLNIAEYCDTDKDVVHVESLADAVQPVEGKPLAPIYLSVYENKIQELKEVTGNRDASTGGTSGGVTSASGLAAQQEAGSKLSRDSNLGAYRAFKQVCLLVIELIRQFYDAPRHFRILGENGAEDFVKYSNKNINPMSQGGGLGMDMGMRKPLFDIEVGVSKASPYSRLSQNDLALQFYSAGFFNPQLADQALACLDMMDFDRKDIIMQKIAQNGGMYQQMLMMQEQIAALSAAVAKDRGIDPSAALGGGVPPQGNAPDDKVKPKENVALGGKSKESAVTENARKRVAESTSPQ